MVALMEWAEDILLSQKYQVPAGYTIHYPFKEIQKTPYSTVVRFSTSKGDVYLKQMPVELSIEPVMMQILQDRFQASVPRVIGYNPTLNAFLMLDSGNSLLDALKSNFQLELSLKVIQSYASIQTKTTDHLSTFLNLGVPDWQLRKLPDLYNQLIDQEDLLRKDGVTAEEFKQLHELSSVFLSACDLLSTDNIRPTLNHCDFHDNNVLVDVNTKNIVIIDWAETVITHPFFSLVAYLTNAGKNYALTEADKIFAQLKDACFEKYFEEDRNRTQNSLFLIKKLSPIYLALGYCRLILSAHMNKDAVELRSYFNTGRNKGRIAKYFKEFIRISAGLDPQDISRVCLTDTYRT